MYAIITPTFKDHFSFVEKYLQSFQKFLKDPEEVCFYFTVSSDEIPSLREITNKFYSLNIVILSFEEILARYGIRDLPDHLLKKYGKFSFQTLKKLYTVLYVKEQYSLILDSESMLVRKTSISELFKKFFKDPFISGSEIQERKLSEFTAAVNHNIDLVLETHIPYFFLENFVWFYDKKILQDLIEKYGYPIEIVENVYRDSQVGSFARYVGIFEIELYHAFIWLHHREYRYRFINISDIFRRNLSSPEIQQYQHRHDAKFEGNCGLLERVMDMLDKGNLKVLSDMVSGLNFNIIRCDHTTIGTYKLQKGFLDIVKPNILAASQDHVFGVNSVFVLVTENGKNIKKIFKHLRRFLIPVVSLLNWISEPFVVVIYAAKPLINLIRLFLWK